MKYHILNTIGQAFTDEGKVILEKLGRVDYIVPSQTDLIKIIGDYDAVLIGLANDFNRVVLEKAGKLKVIATATTGLDHIDLKSAKARNIEVLSLRGENEFLKTITGTAELAWGLILSLARSIPQAFESVRDRREWRRERWLGMNLYGKTLGIVGLGRLGDMVARFGQAFGMKVIFCDPNVDDKTYPEYSKVSFEQLLVQSDVISIHVHLNEQTENMFGPRQLASMKPGAILINTSRGRIVDEKAVINSLESAHLGGYGTDVLTDELKFKEKVPAGEPLLKYARRHRNLIVLPHIGGMTKESRVATDVFMARKLADFLSV